MRVKALVPLNHNGKTVPINKVIELEDETAKQLIIEKRVEEVKDTVALDGVNTKKSVENKLAGEAK
jgi:hypothetical protein